MSRIWLAGVLAALLLPLAPASALSGLVDPAAHAGEAAGWADTDLYMGTRGWRSSTLVVGDSITQRAVKYVFRPRGLGVGWEISSVPGRDVSTLPYYLRDRIDAQQPYTATRRVKRRGHHRKGHRYRLVRVQRMRYPISTVVVALGTNASPGWTYADLSRAVRSLPATTRVVLVTTYRDPVRYPDSASFRQRASVQAAYSDWMARIAAARPHTCVADWRAFAEKWPAMTDDGVHPVNYNGLSAWTQIVVQTVNGCR